MSLKTYLGRQIELEATVLDEYIEEIDRGDLYSTEAFLEESFIDLGKKMTQEADSELLLTEYLLNFEEENVKECAFETEGFSSGVDCSENENEDEASLSSLKETLKAAQKPIKKTKTVVSRPDSWNGKTKQEKDRIRSKEYRERKQNRVKSIEEECEKLKETNKALNERNIELGEKVTSLEKQVEYLESVIANESALASVLGTITKSTGLTFQQKSPLQLSSLKRKRVDSTNGENDLVAKKSNGGVCLHLTPGRVSLEFCQECNVNAVDE